VSLFFDQFIKIKLQIVYYSILSIEDFNKKFSSILNIDSKPVFSIRQSFFSTRQRTTKGKIIYGCCMDAVWMLYGYGMDSVWGLYETRIS